VNGLTIAVIVLVVAVVGVILYKLLCRVAGPNEVLVVSSRRDVGNPELAPRSGLRVVTGRGAFVKPVIETARRLSLAPREAALAVDCLAEADVPLKIKGVVVFKVGDDYTSELLGVTPEEIAGALHTVAQGAKYLSKARAESREEFVARMTAAVRVVLAGFGTTAKRTP
jgi:uncharacterized membrane protein YqiK